jgi:putative ABC transport system ATP-binding protein
MFNVTNISRRYRVGNKDVNAVHRLSLQIDTGEFIIIRGMSGSGKSTLLNIVGVMDEPTAGQLKFEGQDITQLNEKQKALFRRQNIGFVFQSFNLIPVLTAVENVMYPLTLKHESNVKQKALLALEKVGLENFANQRPNELSGGQMQRVAIARALVTEPKVILADEPTANLDSKTAESIMSLMTSLNKEFQTTFIIASHHDYLFGLASRIITMRDGGIIEDVKVQPINIEQLNQCEDDTYSKVTKEKVSSCLKI